MISVLTYDSIGDKIEWLYFDFIEEGKGGKQDFYFVRSVYRWLFGANGLNFKYKTNAESVDPRTFFTSGKKVIIFSDAHSSHAKKKFIEKNKRIRIRWFFLLHI